MMFLSSLKHLASLALVHAIFWILATQPGGGIGDVLNSIASDIRGMVTTVGLTIFLIAVAIAGIMRMVAFGSERRIALSNMALTAAVVGLLIMLLAPALQTFVDTAVP